VPDRENAAPLFPRLKERERNLDALLDEFHIAHLRKSPAIALSGGERRRLEIARALASRPSKSPG
jgi:lipopolysaccharide export system ATP-binding protein